MDFSITDVFNLFDILKRASQHQPLTPSERSWAKAWGGVIDAILIALGLFVVQFIATHGDLSAVNWSLELASFGSIAYKAFKDARSKFFKAQGDPPLNPAPAPAQVTPAPGAAPVAAPVSGGAYPLSPFEQDVPLPRAQRGAAHG